MTRSETLFARALTLFPGGVNSPVRAFRAVGGTPRFMATGRAARMTDVDGNDYLDFCNSWGPLILGHNHPEVCEAMQAVLQKGWTFGTPVELEVELGEQLLHLLPEMEQLRFVSSGTEAVMSALRLARATTDRDKVLKFNGCYHGHVDSLLVQAGSGLATFGTPSSAGVPAGFAATTLSCPLDDEEALSRLFATHGPQLACAIIEGVPANNGLLPQRLAFMRLLRELCTRHGALLIFDEVLSGFRTPARMAFREFGLLPDLITLGKVIGGGMPVGAYAGSRELMGQIAPSGPVYQAGTLSGNPLAMAAGLATLRVLQREGWTRLDERGRELDQLMAETIGEQSPLRYIRCGSLFWLPLNVTKPPRKDVEIPSTSASCYAALFHFFLERGIYLAPSAYEVAFLSAAMEEEDLRLFASTLRGALAQGVLS